MILGDLGADVIKVERPGQGDESRGWGPPFDADGESAYFLSCNRNKLSVALDLQMPADLVVLGGLIQSADVVLENFRTGSLDPLSTHAWFTEPVTTYPAPIANAAATDAGVAMPPASPTRTGVGNWYCFWSRSRRASIVGRRVIAGRLSVCPPLSASAVRSSHIGTAAANSACSAVICPAATSSFTSRAGAGACPADPTTGGDCGIATARPQCGQDTASPWCSAAT